MKLLRIAALAGLAVLLAGCGSHAEVVGASVSSWPQGNRFITGAIRPPGLNVPPVFVKLPSRAPRPLAQGTCRRGTIVELAVYEHHRLRTVRYGPCRRPPAIEVLGRSIRAGHATLQRPLPGIPLWAARHARWYAAAWNDPEPDRVTLGPGSPDMEIPGRKVETITIRGHFSCRDCGVGLDPDEGEIRCSTLTVTADARTHDVVGSGRSVCRKG